MWGAQTLPTHTRSSRFENFNHRSCFAKLEPRRRDREMLRLIPKRRKLEVEVSHKNKLEFLKVCALASTERCEIDVFERSRRVGNLKSLPTLLHKLRTSAIKSRCFIKYQNPSKWLLHLQRIMSIRTNDPSFKRSINYWKCFY